jgi:PKD repeat protein
MASSSTTATIGVGNQAPAADANGPYNGTVGIPVQFDGSGSSDPDGTITAYEWDFGDGSSGVGPNPTHVYATAGTYNVTLTVTDDEGAMDSDATTATIAPVASGADVFLTELWAPEAIQLKSGKRKSVEVIALGGGTSVPQGATVDLTVTLPPSGLDVVVKRPTASEEVAPGERPEQFEFKAKIECMEAGVYTVGWNATISADQNSDPTNDTMLGTTSVLCIAESDEDDEEHDDEHDEHDEEEDDEVGEEEERDDD